MTPNKVEAALGAFQPAIDRLHRYAAHELADKLAEARVVLTEALAERGWRPIAEAPDDGIHIRGLWVTNKYHDGKTSKEWRQYVGLIEDESGRFVDPEYMEDFGWDAGDFEAWMPIPGPPAMKETP